MAVADFPPEPAAEGGLGAAWRRFRNRLVASRKFQRMAQSLPIARTVARKDGERLFDLIAGFTYTQTLYALTRHGVMEALADAERGAEDLANAAGLSVERMRMLCDAGVALQLIERAGNRYALSRLGAAYLGAPGLTDLVLHHRELYQDLADPAGVLAGATDTRLAAYWPYVFGADAAQGAEDLSRYSNLMARSQAMVAEDTLAMTNLSNVKHLMDVGGGSGAFLEAAGLACPHLRLSLYDLPGVADQGDARFAQAGLCDRAECVTGNFREALPETGADAISLVRVLYDHSDDTVRALLLRAYDALPVGGRILISEPMGGGDAPHRFGDVYFAFYCMAMGTGQLRSAAWISVLLSEAGFAEIYHPTPRRPFVTGVVTARKVR